MLLARPSHRHNWWLRSAAAAAAAIALLVGVRQLWLNVAADFGGPPAEIVTGAGELTTVTLGDGTVVRLAPSSRLRLPRGRNAREVWLDGRAYFAVSRDSTRPFAVRTPVGQAIVLGTRFDLRTDGGQVRLLVVEGKVQLEASGHSAPVTARRLAEIAPVKQPTVADVDDEFIHHSLGWTGNFIAFETTPLRDVARELSTHYNVSITLADSTLARETVSGWFADEPFEDVLMIICRAVREQCAVSRTSATISP